MVSVLDEAKNFNTTASQPTNKPQLQIIYFPLVRNTLITKDFSGDGLRLTAIVDLAESQESSTLIDSWKAKGISVKEMSISDDASR